jgi:hypothetical protein
MENKMKLLVLLLISFSIPALAGQDGNGGDVIDCGPDKPVRLLDYVEAEQKGMGIDLGPQSLSVEEKIEYALSRIEAIDLSLHRVLLGLSNRFNMEARFLNGVVLRDVPDSLHLAVPKGCEIKQVAIQVQPRFKEDKWYTVQKELWDRMSNRDKAGLIIHETLLRYFRTPENSIPHRYINARLSGKGFGDMSLDDYQKLIRRNLKKDMSFGAVLPNGKVFVDIYRSTVYPSVWSITKYNEDKMVWEISYDPCEDLGMRMVTLREVRENEKQILKADIRIRKAGGAYYRGLRKYAVLNEDGTAGYFGYSRSSSPSGSEAAQTLCTDY